MKKINLICLLTLLIMVFSRCSNGNEAPPYTYNLKLKFGDNEEHVITSHWEEKKNTALCVKITCDNKDCQFTQDQGASAYKVLIPLP